MPGDGGGNESVGRALLSPSGPVVAATAIAGIALVGHAAEVRGAYTWGATGSIFATVTALLVAVLGIGELAVITRPTSRSAQALAAAMAAGVGLASGAYVVEYLADDDLLVDRWLEEVFGDGVPEHLAHPSLQASVALVLLALSVLAHTTTGRRAVTSTSATLAVAAGAIGAQGLVAWTVGAERFWASPLTAAGGLSIPGALAVVLLSSGWVLHVARDAVADVWRDPAARQILRLLVPAAFLVPLLRASLIERADDAGANGPERMLVTVVAAVLVAVLVAMVWQVAKQVQTIDRERKLLLDLLPAPVLVELAGQVHHANQAAVTLVGAGGLAELVDADPAVLLGARPEDLVEVRRQVASGGAVCREMVCGLPSGEAVLEVTARTIDWSRGRAVVYVIVDRSANARFEQSLQEARLSAEEASTAKSDFLSRMSHELRTPLNSVLGFAQLLELEGLPDRQQDAAASILKAGRHLLDLINEVLDLSRIESGNLTLSPEPVLLASLVDDAMGLVRPLAEVASVHLVFDARESCNRYVLADRQRSTQVLLNLLSNAIKYNRHLGTVVVDCQCHDDGTCRVNVTDTGPGMRPEQLDRLFVPFDRLGAEHTAVEGTGIGLALSRQLAQAMGGDIGVDSAVGEGSTFWCSFPEVEGPVDRYERLNGADAPAAAPATTRGPQGETPVILHIEDNLENLRLVDRLLEASGRAHTVIAAMQGRLGVELAREHRPAVILLDLHLPDVGGEEVLRLLRDDPVTAETPVVILSADATPKQTKRLLAAGAVAYVTKPIDVRSFLVLLGDLLDSR